MVEGNGRCSRKSSAQRLVVPPACACNGARTRMMAVEILMNMVGFGIHFRGKGFIDGLHVDYGNQDS